MQDYGQSLAVTGAGPIGAYIVTGSWLVGVGAAAVVLSAVAIRIGFRRGKSAGDL